MSGKKLKILQLNKLYPPYIGGIEHVVQQLAEGLAGEFEVSVLACNDRFRHVREEVNGIPVTRVAGLGMLGSLPVPLGLTHALRQAAGAQDIIHLHMPFPFGDLACLLSGYRGKVVVWWHSDVVRQKRLVRLYRPVMVRMLERADQIIVATKGHIGGSAYLGPYREKCVVIPFGVDRQVEAAADRYCEDPAGHGAAYPAGTKRPTRFLFLGRLVYYKGCRVLLEAFARVRGAELVLVGDGPMEAELRQLAGELRIARRVSFCGKLTKEGVYRQYGACDALVLPSIARSEAFGLVQIEAMAFGKPVINTRLPSGVPHVSLDGLTGLTVPPGDAPALAGAMQWMVDHGAERLEMGKNARVRMKAEFREETMIGRVKRLYYEICG